MAHSPLHCSPDPADRLAAIILLLEAAPAPELTLIPLAVRSGRCARAVIIARLPDGGRETLTPDEARLLAACLAIDPSYAEARLHADALWSAAEEAQGRADRFALRRDCGREAAAISPTLPPRLGTRGPIAVMDWLRRMGRRG